MFGLLVWTKRRDVFGGKNVLLVEIFLFFVFQNICQIFNAKTWKRNHDLDVECKSQDVFLQFWIFTFLSFQ